MKEKEKREHKAKEDSRLEDDLLEMCIKESLLEKERLGLETTTALPSEPDFGRRKGQRRGGGRHCWDRSAIAQAAATRAQHHAAVKEVEQFENATKEQSHSNEQLSPTVQSSTVGGCPAWERVGVAKAAATRAQVHTAVKEVEQFEIQSKEVKTEENLEAKNKPTTLSSLLAESEPPTPPPKLMARFVRDVSMPDGSEIAPHSTFFKTWRVRNDGKGDWPEGCHLVSAGGDRLLDAKLGEDYVLRQPVPVAAAGEEIELTLELCAPDATGRHVGYFRLENPEGSYFGQRLWADIRVNDADMSMSMTLTPWEVVDSSTDDKQQEEEKEVNEEEEVSTATTTVTPDVEQSIEEVLQKSNDNAVLNTEDDRDRLLEETPLLQEHQQEQQEQFDAELALWSKELRVLSAMGFHDLEQLLPLLKAHITVPASTRDVGTEEPGSESGLQAVVLALLSGQE